MNKILLSFLGLFLILSVGFVSAGDLTITDTVNTVGASVNPGSTLQGSFKLHNINTATAITNVDITSTSFTTGSNTIPSSAIVFNPDPIASIAANGTQSVAFTLTMPTYQVLGIYTGTITAADGTSNSVTTPVSFTVNTVQQLSVISYSTSTPLRISGEDGKTVSSSFTIKNEGNVDLLFTDASITHNVELSDGDHNITLSFTSIPATLTPGASDAITVTAVIPSKMEVGEYTGTVTLTSGTATASFGLEISVQPEVCEDGPVGKVTVTISDPDDGDEFAPGDTIEVDVDVENNDDDEMDVGVTAFLYNINEDDNIVEEDSDTIEIGDDDEESFTVELQLPLDGNLDDSDKYKLFVKAYEDGNEDDNCAEDSIDIEIKREKNDVRVDSAVLSPSIASCGEVVEVNVDTVNVGSNDQDDVYVEIKNSELGLSEKSGEFDLENGNEADNDMSTSLSFTVPSDAKAKDYQIEAIVHYDDDAKKNSEFVTLSVENCGEEEEPVTPVTGEAELEVVATNIEAKANTFSVPIKVTNKDTEQKTYTVEISNLDDWAEAVSAKTLTLNSEQSSTIYFYVKANDDATGKQSATINLKDTESGKVVTTQTITLDLGEEAEPETEEPETSVWDTISGWFKGGASGTNGTVFWIILDVVLVVVAIVFIKILFTRKSKQ